MIYQGLQFNDYRFALTLLNVVMRKLSIILEYCEDEEVGQRALLMMEMISEWQMEIVEKGGLNDCDRYHADFLN